MISVLAQLVAESAITWTPTTFYVLMGIIHVVVIVVGYRLMGVDPEHNSFVGGIIASVVINGAAFAFRDVGVVGVMIAGATTFGVLVAVSSGEALKALFMTAIVIASYGLVGPEVVKRTPLSLDDLAGFPRVVATGGLEAEPISEQDHANLEKAGFEENK